MTFSTKRLARPGLFMQAMAIAFFFLVRLASAQQELSDDYWTGTWSGPYNFLTACGLTNSGTITLYLNVADGAVTGSGTEDSVICGDCTINGYGTFSGPVYGSVSGTNFIFGGSWFDSCNFQNYDMEFTGTLSGDIITGSGGSSGIRLFRLGVTNNCTIDAGTVYQRIDGFGGASAFKGDWTPELADMFFSTNTGIGLSLLRSRIAPDGTTIETNIMQMAQARGAKVWSTPWSPPAEFKDTGTVNGGNFLSSFNQTYASQLADYVLNMKTRYGIDICAISIQNEPTYNTTRYESCIWSGQQFHDFVPYLSQALSNSGVASTKIIMPEEAGWDFALATNTVNDPATSNLFSILAGHGYFNSAARVDNMGKTLWQSEAADFSWFDPTMNNGIYWAGQIHAFMTVARVNAFVYWWLVALSPDNEGLTGEDASPTKRMYVLGQYARFIRPGFNRIGAFANTNTLVSAYQDPANGNFAIVAINPNSTPLTQNFNLTNFNSALVTPWRTSDADSLAVQPSIIVSNNSFSYTFPPDSIVTFVGQTNNVIITTQPQNQTVAAGDSATFTISATGAPPLNYFWEQNGTFIPGATNAIYFLPSAPVADNGSQFFCIVSNSYGSVTSSVATLTVANLLYSFHGFDGVNPSCALMQTSDGTLYGTAQAGGTYGAGTLFGLTTNGLLTTLVSFNTTNGATPMAGLTRGADGNLYGTTEFGGNANAGTVFSLSTNSQLTTLYSFTNGTGANPTSGLVQGADGNFYGTTPDNIFQITTNGTLTTLASFNAPVTGSGPHGNLIQASDGNFYGTTSEGGAFGNGTVFKMTPDGTLTAVVSFANGSSVAGLLQGSDGNFYGTMYLGGTTGNGAVFKLTPDGVLTMPWSFDPSTKAGGSQPDAAVLQATNGNFYGTTYVGGDAGNGAVFAASTNGTPITLLSFEGVDGANPQAALLLGQDGGFYGTTVNGGIGWNGAAGSGNGTIFRLPFPSAPVIIAPLANKPVGVGSKATFTINVSGSEPLKYFWLRNGAVIAGATNFTLTLTNVTTPNVGNYAVVVSNAFGMVTSTVATLTITNAVCVEPDASIVAWWPGESNAVDIIDGHSGVLENGISFTNALVGNGFVFDGVSSYVQLSPSVFNFPNGHPFSIELWFETTSGGVILEQQGGTPFAGTPGGWLPQIYVGTDGNLYVQLFWNGFFNQVGTSTPVNDGAFHHLAVAYDGNNEIVYLDSVELGAELLPYSTYSTGFVCQLGTGYTQNWPAGNGGWYTFNGVIDELTLYSNALTGAQVRAIYNAYNAGKCTDQLVPFIVTQPTNQAVLAGSPAVFSVTGSSLVTLGYQWFFGTNALSGATNATLTLPNVSLHNAGHYFAVASNFYGSVTSTVVTLSAVNPPCVEPPPGAVAWWPGEDNALDVIGGQNGVVNGSSFASGRVGDGFFFDGTGGYVQLPTNLFPPPNAGPFSIEFWFQTSSGGVILEQQNPPYGWLPMMYVATDGRLYAQLFWNGNFDQMGSGVPVNDGRFHHYAITYDGANETGYLDGALIGTRPQQYSSYTSGFATLVGTGETAYWAGAANGMYPFNGIIDELTLYSNVLTPAQVLAIYNAQGGGKCTDELLPVIIAQPANQTVPVGGTATFSIAATSLTPLGYQWFSGASTLPGATNASVAITNIPLSDSGAQIFCLVTNFLGSSSSSVAMLNVLPNTMTLSHVKFLSTGILQMDVTGLPGTEFRVLASTNLTDWQPIATLTNFNGTVQFADPDTTNFSSRYYRLVAP